MDRDPRDPGMPESDDQPTERLVRWFDERYARSCHELAPSGSKAGDAVAKTIRRLKKLEEKLPGPEDLLSFLEKESAGGVVFYEMRGRLVPISKKTNLVLWYAARAATLLLFRVTREGQVSR